MVIRSRSKQAYARLIFTRSSAFWDWNFSGRKADGIGADQVITGCAVLACKRRVDGLAVQMPVDTGIGFPLVDQFRESARVVQVIGRRIMRSEERRVGKECRS